jgi:hypothetical protein
MTKHWKGFEEHFISNDNIGVLLSKFCEISECTLIKVLTVGCFLRQDVSVIHGYISVPLKMILSTAQTCHPAIQYLRYRLI